MSTSSPSPSTAFTTASTPSGTDTPQYGGIHPHAYIVVLSVLGGITLLCLLVLIGYWYIKQRRWNHQCSNESFWRNWHLKAYSRVDTLHKDSPPGMSQRGHHDYDYDDDFKTAGGMVDADADADTDKKSGGSIMDWWYGKRRSALKMVEEGFEVEPSASNEKLKKKQKQKSATVHKVKRFKPNGSFEIDSDVRMSVVGSLAPSRSR